MNAFFERFQSGKSRIILGIVVVVVIYFSYTYFAAPSVAPQYITAAVEKGTLTVSVSATGQVSSSQQIDIKPQVSGDVVALMVKGGQQVSEGQPLLQLDARDQERAVRDAQLNLESANLSLKKLVADADALSLLQAENAVTNAKNNLAALKLTQPTEYQKAQEAKRRALDEIQKGHDDSFSSISSTFLDIPSIITGLDDGLHGTGISDSERSLGSHDWNGTALLSSLPSDGRDTLQTFVTKAESDYKDAKAKYDQNFINYKNVNRFSTQEAISTLLAETLEMTRSVSQAAKSQSNMYDTWVELRVNTGLATFARVTSYQSTMSGYISKADSHTSSLLTSQQAVKDNQQAVINADRDLLAKDQNNPLDLVAAEQSIKEKEAALEKLKGGPTSLDIQQQELSVRQRENALMDAQDQFDRTLVRAPFDGLLAKVSVKVHDAATSGTAIATLITKQRIAEVTLNEVDVSRVKVGQKVVLKLDAFETLTFAGQVLEVDTLGTVTQGVVSYAVKIGFDTQDDKVKPGMSVSASIITDVKSDILMVPSSAVKSQNGDSSYVDILAGSTPGVVMEGQPVSQTVEVGVSNDTSTEIISGAKEGDLVVTQTITPSATTAASAQRSLIPGMSGGSGGGSAARMGGR